MFFSPFSVLTHLHCAISYGHTRFSAGISTLHTSTVTRPHTDRTAFVLPSPSFSLSYSTHAVILASSLSLSVSHTVCFLLSHRLGYSVCTHRAGNMLPDANPPTPSGPTSPCQLGQPWHKSSHWVRGTLCDQEAKQRIRRKMGRACPVCELTPCTPSPSTEERGHLKPGHLRLCLSQNLRWVGLRQHISNFL